MTIMCHNARLDLINRHFRITRSDWSITLSGRSSKSPRYVNPVYISREREIIRTFSRESVDFRGHIVDDLRTTFDRAATIDESTVLPARCVRMSMKHLSHCTFATVLSSNYKIAQKITVVSTVPEWIAAEALVRYFVLWYFSIIFGTTGFGQNELLAPIASAAYNRVIFLILDGKGLMHVHSLHSKDLYLHFFKEFKSVLKFTFSLESFLSDLFYK